MNPSSNPSIALRLKRYSNLLVAALLSARKRRRIQNLIKKRRLVSPLTRRILTINIIALGILVVGLLYLDQYRKGLVRAELDALTIQAKIFAGALGEVAIEDVPDAKAALLLQPSRDIIRRLAPPTLSRARLFDYRGRLMIDSRVLGGKKGRSNSIVQVEVLHSATPGFWGRTYQSFRSWESDFFNWHQLPLYLERTNQTSMDYDEVIEALNGNIESAVRRLPNGGIILSVAVPVQHYRHVLGALMLSKSGEDIEAALRNVRLAILKVSLIGLLVTIMLSAYLARTLTQPILRLADAANRMRASKSRDIEIPDLSNRDDEIGDLSAALRDMTQALWQRLDAIEHFAADVAHEIKNPLNSLRSAIETANRIDDPAKLKKLLAIILDDVHRLNRLITDISEASRVDSDMSKSQMAPIDLIKTLATMAQIYKDNNKHVRVELFLDPTEELKIMGLETRLAQVLRNLMDNAISFSPEGGLVSLNVVKKPSSIDIVISDEGPGIPPDRLEKIFDRFYTDRPAGEKFGKHSGLGLSISRQIIAAMGGNIHARNKHGERGKVTGAEFIVELPKA